MNRDKYIALRRRYEPDDTKLVIVAESPPASGLCFYNPDGRTTEPLFTALMQQLGQSPASKKDGLTEFKREGWVLVDATYEPVNALSERKRNEVIVRDYPLLRDDLSSMLTDRSTPVILVKANVCEILEPKLIEDGFNILNQGCAIYFPSHGRQKEFHSKFSTVREAARLGPVAPVT